MPEARGRDGVQVTDRRALDERYNHAPRSFNAAVDAFEIPGEQELSMIVRRVCRTRSVWPDLLQSGKRPPSQRLRHVVYTRRLLWRAAYERTDLSVENIGDLFGFAAGTVRPWATSWRSFEVNDPIWWRYWGLSCADDIGVSLVKAAP